MTLRLRLTRLCWCPSLPTGFWSPASSSSFLFFLSLRFFSFSFSFCSYPVLTMLLQSLASMLVALECVLRSPPQVYLDTTGYSFTLPVVKLLTRARTAAYIHYPTISTVRVCVCVCSHTLYVLCFIVLFHVQSMIQRVQEKRPSYNNRSSVAGSDSITSAKLMFSSCSLNTHPLSLFYSCPLYYLNAGTTSPSPSCTVCRDGGVMWCSQTPAGQKDTS